MDSLFLRNPLSVHKICCPCYLFMWPAATNCLRGASLVSKLLLSLLLLLLGPRVCACVDAICVVAAACLHVCDMTLGPQLW